MSGKIGTSHSKSKVIGRSQDTAKAWVNYNGNATPAINDSYNVSSVTDNGTGHYTINYATTLANAYQAKVMSTDVGGWAAGRFQVAIDTTTSSQVKLWHSDGTITDGLVYFIAFGD